VCAGQAALHQLVASQAMVADAADKDLFIEVVCLKATVSWRDGFSFRRPVEFVVNSAISTVG
jgi:hypothetical protein